MDESFEPARVRFTPDRRYTALAAVGVAAALLACLLGNDAPGRLLAALAAVVLGSYVAADLVFTPRLVVDRDGVAIRSPFTRAQLSWPQIDAVRTDSRIRLGIRSTTLEIDAGPVLAVLSRRALGADPVEVEHVLARFRPPPGR
ncbi:PH domain-containing protein [uncultured Jatrophihabitans sp.]|uniref:PH domain-containing protein n=1 Tax=uncultured Jatrophihabitans sp. TaxID=1610747 RepID=UPI0035C94B54